MKKVASQHKDGIDGGVEVIHSEQQLVTMHDLIFRQNPGGKISQINLLTLIN